MKQFACGDRHEGQYVDDKRQGYGQYVTTHNTHIFVMHATWINSEPTATLRPFLSLTITLLVIHGCRCGLRAIGTMEIGKMEKCLDMG